MDSDRPLVVDNGTGVSFHSTYTALITDLAILVRQSRLRRVQLSRAWYARRHLLIVNIILIYATSIPFHRRSSHPSCRRTNRVFYHQRYHDRRRSSIRT